MIEPIELIGVRLSMDGKHLRLHIRDQNGQVVFLSLPASWLSSMLNVLPRLSIPDTLHSLASWSMERISNGQDLVLTLRNPEGWAVSFTMKAWQVEGMATIATYGTSGNAPVRTVH